MSNRKTPELRFEGFSDDWEQRKLEYLCQITDAKHATAPVLESESKYKMIRTSTVRNGNLNINQMDNVSKEVYDAWSERIYLKYNDVVFSREAPIGEVSIIPNDNNLYFLGQRMVAMRVNEKLSPRFLVSTFMASKFKKEISIRNAESTTVANFGITSLNKYEISLPTYEEQTKIGNFFKQLDETITLQERELDLLKEQKKGFLQKMFPKNNKNVPELRFEGFTEAWQQRKVGNVFSERSERSGEGELISVTIKSGVVKASELDRKDNSSNDKSNYKKVEVGDIAYNSMRMWQGASGYSFYNGILSPAYTVIIPKEGTDSKFFAYNFKRFNMIQIFKRNSQGLTSDTWNLKFPTLKSVKVIVPSIEEQKQISTFLESLDMTITLQEQKLNKLKEMKKGFLQKMFV